MELFTTQAITQTRSGTGNSALDTITVTDPVTNESIVAGTVFVNQVDVPVSTSGSRTLPGGTGVTFRRDFVRDRSFNGFHTTRASTVGTTIITTTVSEVRYNSVRITQNTGGISYNNVLIDNASLHDFHYQ